MSTGGAPAPWPAPQVGSSLCPSLSPAALGDSEAGPAPHRIPPERSSCFCLHTPARSLTHCASGRPLLGSNLSLNLQGPRGLPGRGYWPHSPCYPSGVPPRHGRPGPPMAAPPQVCVPLRSRPSRTHARALPCAPVLPASPPREAGPGAHPTVARCDVLQGPGGCLGGVRVELTALQQPIVQPHDLGAPQPLETLGVLGDLSEGESVGREGRLERGGEGQPGSGQDPAPRLPRPAPTSRSRRLWGVKQPTTSPGGAPAVSLRPRPSSRCRADGGISSYRR